MSFESLTHAKYCLLTTFRSSGKPVSTPVWFVRDGSSILICTNDPSGKVRRIRRDGRAQVAPCTFRGRTTADPQACVARILAGDEAAEAKRTMHAGYSVGKRLFYRFVHPVASRRTRMVFIRVDPLNAGKVTMPSGR